MKEYKILSLERRKDAYVIPPHKPKPMLGPSGKKNFYRVLDIKDDGKTAVICANMQTPTLIVQDADVSRFGRNSLKLGDIIAYENGDLQFQRPIITHRFHQRHTHPPYLVAPDEK